MYAFAYLRLQTEKVLSSLPENLENMSSVDDLDALIEEVEAQEKAVSNDATYRRNVEIIEFFSE